MKELSRIIGAYEQAEKQGLKTALATVVDVEGSSYRAPGARMLVTEDGVLTGGISGGCLESDALRKALMVILQDTPLLVTYRTTDEEDGRGGISLGCNGVIRVLIEPVHREDPQNPVALLKKAMETSPAVLVTFFSSADPRDARQGTSGLIRKEEQDHPASIEARWREEGDGSAWSGGISGELKKTFESGQSRWTPVVPGLPDAGRPDMIAFLEYIPNGLSLVIAGAGTDVLPVVQMAEWMGWGITLIDGRPRYARSPGFAQCNLIVAAPEDAVLDPLLHDRSACLLMSHNYHYDKAMMRRLSAYPVPYVGMLGPRKKKERMLHELEQEGIRFTADQLTRIHSPVGLDIGAQTPEEIALAITAEISMVFSGRTGKPLKGFAGSIHGRIMAAAGGRPEEQRP